MALLKEEKNCKVTKDYEGGKQKFIYHWDMEGKYTTVPIPDAEVTLNQSDLVSAATSEKTALIERLRAYFDETSRDKLMERRALETENRIKELAAVPYPIYIG